MRTVTQIEQAIQTVFGAADQLGRETGFVQRVPQGKFTGASFAATLALGLLQVGEVSLSTLAQFARPVGVQVTAQGIDERFGPRCAQAGVAGGGLHPVGRGQRGGDSVVAALQ